MSLKSQFLHDSTTKVGATTMDRPEWVAVNPKSKHTALCKNRGVKDNQPINAVNQRK